MKIGDVCVHCKLTATESATGDDRAVDPCLGILPGVDFACCGHGGKVLTTPAGERYVNEPYIKWSSGLRIGFLPISIETKGRVDVEDRQINNISLRRAERAFNGE